MQSYADPTIAKRYQTRLQAEEEHLFILPSFRDSKVLETITGDLGPFEPGVPVYVPLWLALKLKQDQKCRIVQPEWLKADRLRAMKKEEKDNDNQFSDMPFHYIEIAWLLLSGWAREDIESADTVESLIEDIETARREKMQKGVDVVLKVAASKHTPRLIDLTHASAMEVNTLRHTFFRALDRIVEAGDMQRAKDGRAGLASSAAAASSSVASAAGKVGGLSFRQSGAAGAGGSSSAAAGASSGAGGAGLSGSSAAASAAAFASGAAAGPAAAPLRLPQLGGGGASSRAGGGGGAGGAAAVEVSSSSGASGGRVSVARLPMRPAPSRRGNGAVGAGSLAADDSSFRADPAAPLVDASSGGDAAELRSHEDADAEADAEGRSVGAGQEGAAASFDADPGALSGAHVLPPEAGTADRDDAASEAPGPPQQKLRRFR